jgi:hypothetical protein
MLAHATIRGAHATARRHRSMPRRFAFLIVAIIASQAWPLSVLLPILPSGRERSRSPSSDALMQALPLPDAAQRIDTLDDVLPLTAGVVVGHGPSDQLTSAYFVLSMRLWPRLVSYVACEPLPHLEQIRPDYPVPAFSWRVDLFPGNASPLHVNLATPPRDAAALCDLRPGP